MRLIFVRSTFCRALKTKTLKHPLIQFQVNVIYEPLKNL